MRFLIIPLGALALTACTTTVPDSGAGVGFDDYGSYQAQREQQLTQGVRTPTTVQPPAPATTTTTAVPATEGDDVAADTVAALGGGTPAPAAPQITLNNPGISTEQDFDAVSSQRDIAADAARIQAARQQYVLVEAEDLQRVGDTGPNIIQYALSTSHAVGTKVHRRTNPFARARAESKCAGFRTDDVAQEQFLAAGGPERDRLGLDPDGDGYACGWNPATYRQLVRN